MHDKRVRAPYLCSSLYDMFGWSPNVGSRLRGDISTSSRDDIIRWLKKPDDAGLQVKSSIRAAKSSHSTVFWDLDEYTRKRSYHCYFEVPVSGSKLRDIIDIPVPYPRVKVGPEPHEELNGHGDKIKSKIFTNNALSQRGNDPTVINRAKKDDPVVETDSKNKFMFDKSLNTDHPSKLKHERRKRYRRPSLICPQCQANVECISQTTLQNTKKADSVKDKSAIKSLGGRKKSEYYSQYNCKTPCSLLPLDTEKILPPEALSYSRSKRRTPTKLSRVIRIVRACRHHPPCPVAPSCQKLNVIKNKCKVIPPCPHSPRCVNLPVCIPLAEEKKFLEYENSEESSNVVSADYLRPKPTYQFKADCCAFSQNEDRNFTLESKESSIVSLQPSQKTLFNKSPVQVMSAFLQRTKSCQYEYIEFNKDFTYRPPDEGIVFVRDVGCQFRSRHKSGSSFVSRVNSTSTCYELKNIKIGSARCYVNKCTSPVALSDCKSCKSSCSDSEKTSHDASQGLTDSQEPEPEETWSGKLMKETEGPASPEGCGPPAVCAYRVEVNNPAARSRHNLLGKYKRFTLKRRRRSRGFCCSK